jgi:hypothetical protein
LDNPKILELNATQQQTTIQQATFDKIPSISMSAGGKLKHHIIQFSNEALLTIVNCSAVNVHKDAVYSHFEPVEFQLHKVSFEYAYA